MEMTRTDLPGGPLLAGIHAAMMPVSLDLQNCTNLRLIYIISCYCYLALKIIINGIIIIIVIY